MLKLLKKINKIEVFMIVICLIFIIGQVWLDLKLPDYMSEITKLVQTEGSGIGEILEQGAYMLACAGGSLIFACIVGYFASYIASSFSKKLRGDLFEKVEDFSMEEMNKFSISSLITRTTNDVTQVEMLIAMGLGLIVKAPITAVWAIMKILGKSFAWSAITGGAVLILLITIGILMKLVFPNFKKVQKIIDQVNNVTRENLTGIRVVRAFNGEKYQEEKFEKENKELTNLQTFNQRRMAIMSPIMYLIMNGLTLAIYFVGAYIIEDAGMLDKIGIFSDMVVFSSYAMQVIMSFLMLAMIFMMWPRASVSAKRILEVLQAKISIKDGSIKEDNGQEIGTVEFRNVSFKYPDGQEQVLKNISFKANRGDTVAIIGSTGCGKSTLINLIPRFFDTTDGEILVDGINVKEYNQEFLHNKIGYVPQRAVMFSDTVKGNVSYGENGKETKEEEIIKAIEVAQGKDFVEKMENKYESHIASGGTNISGGQKQRLAIARAIARKPEIYIFDDSFSALDYKTDSKLRKELKVYTKDATNIIVAQRIGTVMYADEIIVLDEGKCVGKGKHKELLKNCPVYREIAYSQLSKEELEDGE
ncbi:MAG: ABC transporter ATP-binding protein [Clostridia bacterium]|nr:ABC transporter ATP-binding protein [Clostridia bacterium]